VGLLAAEHAQTSAMVSSPSRLTTRLKARNSCRVSSGTAEEWEPPMTVTMSGKYLWANPAILAPLMIVGVMQEKPTTRGWARSRRSRNSRATKRSVS
tara:strand:+ start:53087 stop:53377 length:291 start_codon:yes stop_codon:yes gene_type:complete